jgi:pimeloyl-ACP methyl ester carboxylesterase
MNIRLRTFQGAGIELKGVECSPEEPLGTVYLVHGLSGKWEDYSELIEPLAQKFRVCAYNQRGHSDSPGKFDIQAAADDLENVIGHDGKRPAGILAHSLDGLSVEVAKRFEDGEQLQGVYMLEPYLGLEFLNLPQRLGVRAARVLSVPLWPADKLFNMCQSLRRKLGFNNRDVVASYGSLVKVDSADSEGAQTPVGYMLADQDEILGTTNEKHYERCLQRLNELFPNGEDDSEAARSLNHCLNSTKNDFRPFMKQEGVDKKQIVEIISSFFERNFA